jgi:hypothetical protein
VGGINMAKEAENRRNPRVNAKWPLTVLSEHGRIEGETKNISISGVLIRCDEPLHLNEFLRLALEPPLKPPIWVSGEVIWSDSDRSHENAENYAMGFSFVEISDIDQVLLKDLVSLAATQH